MHCFTFESPTHPQNTYVMNYEELKELAEKLYADYKRVLICVESAKKEYEANIDIMQYHKITLEEFLALYLLEEFASDIIQKPFFNENKINAFNEECVKLLDSLLQKMPKTKHHKLYRQEDNHPSHSIIKGKQYGETYTFPHYLTTSKDNFDNKSIIYEITPKSDGTTKAHDVYLLHNKANEYQVEFERNTTFRIDNIVESGDKEIVYLTEV